jgi:hypothetical protein
MLKDQCISVTDLRVNTKDCLSGLKRHAKYIFVNNRPKAVIIDIDEYENLFGLDFVPQFIEMSEKELTPEIKKAIEKTKKTAKSKLLNI